MNSCSLKMSYSSFERWHPLSDKPALSVCVPVPKLPGLFWLSVWTHFKIITAGSHLNSEPNWALNVNICNLSHAPDQDLIPVGGQENKQKTTTKTTQQNTTTTKTLQKKARKSNPLWFHFLSSRGGLPFKILENKVFLLVRLTAKLPLLGSSLIEFLTHTTG